MQLRTQEERGMNILKNGLGGGGEGWRMGSERGLPRYHLVETSSRALIGITSIATIRSATARLAIR